MSTSVALEPNQTRVAGARTDVGRFAANTVDHHPRLTLLCGTTAASFFAWLAAGPTAAMVLAVYTFVGARAWHQWRHHQTLAVTQQEAAAEVSFLAADLQAGANPNRALASTLAQWPDGAESVRAQLLAAWKVSARLGAPATNICRALGRHLQEHVALSQRLKAQTSSIKATAGLLLVLPVFGILLGESMGASPINFLFNSWVGFSCVVLVLALQAMGWLWVQQLLKSVTRGSGAPHSAGEGPPSADSERPDSLEKSRFVQVTSASGNNQRGSHGAAKPGGGSHMFHVEHVESSRAARDSASASSVARRMCWAAVSGAVGVGVLVVLSGWFSYVAAGGVAWGCYVLLSRQTVKASGSTGSEITEQWLWCLDLLAAGLKSGVPFPQAAAAVAKAVPTPLSQRVSRVSQLLMMGAPIGDALAELGPLPGRARLVSQLERSGWSGAAMASGLQELSASLRRQQLHVAETRAGRASVLLVGPLCLCFLPAFVVAGVVPVIFGLASGTLLPS